MTPEAAERHRRGPILERRWSAGRWYSTTPGLRAGAELVLEVAEAAEIGGGDRGGCPTTIATSDASRRSARWSAAGAARKRQRRGRRHREGSGVTSASGNVYEAEAGTGSPRRDERVVAPPGVNAPGGRVVNVAPGSTRGAGRFVT